jgi:hypothetical protein
MKKLLGVSVFLLAFFGVSTVIAAPPQGIQGNVTVQNGDANPVPVAINSPLAPSGAVAVEGEVTIGNQEVRVPFQRAISSDFWPAGEDFHGFNMGIPSDKTLEVQTVSISARVEIGQEVWAQVTSQGSFIGLSSHPILLTKQGTFDGLDLYVGTTLLTTYAEGGSGLLVSVKRDSTTGDGGNIAFSVSGYLLDTMIH